MPGPRNRFSGQQSKGVSMALEGALSGSDRGFKGFYRTVGFGFRVVGFGGVGLGDLTAHLQPRKGVRCRVM